MPVKSVEVRLDYKGESLKAADARSVIYRAGEFMLPNQGLLISGTFALAIASSGFFFAQFSRSTKKTHQALLSSGPAFLLGAGLVVAALIV